MKTLKTALLVGLLVASAQAQTALDKKPRSAGPGRENVLPPQPSLGGFPTATFTYRGNYLINAHVTAVFDDMATVMTPTRVTATLPIADLPAVLKSEALHRKSDQMQAAYAERMKKENPLQTATVMQITKDGLLVSQGDTRLLLVDHPRADSVVDGDVVKFRGEPGGQYQYKTVLGAAATIRVIKVTSGE